MTNENIKFPRQHFVIYNNYFYYFDERNNVLYQKVNNGDVVFTYPINGILGSNQVTSLEYDGYYFWSLQQGNTNEDIIIKKWAIKNFICELVDSIELNHNADHKFNSTTFALEYYNTSLTEDLPKGSSELILENYGQKIESGTILSIGPDEYNRYEDVTVTGTLPGINKFGLNFYTEYDYLKETNVYFSKNIWLINHFLYTDPGGGLYKINLPGKEIDDIVEEEDFESVISSCFYNTIDTQYILFNIGTTLRFFNIDTLTVEKSMVMDNIEDDQVTLIPIYDIEVIGDSLYRLQKHATYFGTDNDFSTYNYQPSTLRPFIDSVTVDVSPKILPSNGVNVADVIAIIKDQYGEPIVFKTVKFEDTDPTGYMLINEDYTNLYGVAESNYRSGVSPASVIIRATATQYD